MGDDNPPFPMVTEALILDLYHTHGLTLKQPFFDFKYCSNQYRRPTII